MRSSELNTVDLPSHEEIPAWERFNAHHMVQLNCHTIEPRLHGHQRCVEFPSLRGVRIHAGSHTIFRTREHTERAPNRMVQISTVEGGELYFQDQHGMNRIGEDTILVFDTDSPYSITFSTEMTMHSLLIPKQLVSEHSPGLLAEGKVIALASSAVRAAQVSVFSGHPVDVSGVVRSLRAPSPMEGLFLEASGILGARFPEQGLNLADLAAQMHLSQRHLARVFATRNTTFSRQLLRLRLAGVAEDLTDPRHAHLRIGEVFHQNGFSSPSHGHRRFVECFGTTPAQYRNHQAGVNESAHR